MMHSLRQLLTLVIAFACVSQLAAKVWLVSVGIADYPGKRNDLNNTAHDAQAIAWIYSKIPGTEAHLLLNRQATRANIVAKMEDAFGQATEDDLIIFFFSGHGYQGGFVDADGGRLTYADVQKVMSTSRSRNRIVFADACFSGHMGRTTRASQEVVEAARRSNIMFFFSSRFNETSIERIAMKNGFFTTYLQQGLRGDADKNSDRIVTARELYEYVHAGVIEISHGKQHPVMWGHFSDAMPVAVWK